MHNVKSLDIYTLNTMPIEQVLALYAQGYRLDESISEIRSMAANCQVSTKTVGQVITLSATPSGGTPPYTVDLKKDGAVIRQFTGVASGATVTHQYTLTSSDVGTRKFSTIAYDSCPGAPKATPEELCNINVTSSTPTCPAITAASISCPGSATQGSSATFTASWTGGKSPYTVKFFKDSDSTPFATVNASGTSTSTSQTINWTTGNHTVYFQVLDSCSPVQSYWSGNTCSLSVTSSCVPNWQCEQPLNGYEADGCGNRRANSACSAVTPPPTGCPGCDLTKNICILDNCVPKNYAIYAGVGFVALLLLTR